MLSPKWEVSIKAFLSNVMDLSGKGVASLWEPEFLDDLKKRGFFFIFVVVVFLKTQLGKCTNKLTNCECMHNLEVKADKDLPWRRGGRHEVPFNTQLAEAAVGV